MLEAKEIRSVISCVQALRADTIQLINNPDARLAKQRELVEHIRATLTLEENRLSAYEARVADGGTLIDHCDKRLIELRDKLVRIERAELINRLKDLQRQRNELQANDAYSSVPADALGNADVGNPDNVEEEMIVS